MVTLLGCHLQRHRDPGCGRRALPFTGNSAAPGVGCAGDERFDRDCDDQRAAAEPRAVRYRKAARCRFDRTTRPGVRWVLFIISTLVNSSNTSPNHPMKEFVHLRGRR